jgi:hypothetical protein
MVRYNAAPTLIIFSVASENSLVNQLEATQLETPQRAGALATFVYSAPRWKLVTFLVIVNVLKSGVWYIPNLAVSLRVAKNPFSNGLRDFPEAHYIFWSWFAPFLAWRIGATGQWSFTAFHLVFAIGFTALFIAMLFARLPEPQARTALILFTVLPVSATAYFWISMDGVTLFLMACALALRKYWPLSLLVGIALGMQHFEQGFCALGVLIVALLLGKYFKSSTEYSVRWAVASLAGVVIGKGLLMALFIHWHIELNSGRLYWLLANRRLLLGEFVYHFQYIIYSVFGVGWIFVLKTTELGRKAIPLFIGIAGALLLLPISADQTRVVAIVSFMLVAVFCLLNLSFLTRLDKQFVSWLLATWLIVPYAWVWNGNPKWSVLPYDIVMLLHKLHGCFSVPPNQSQWPFQ